MKRILILLILLPFFGFGQAPPDTAITRKTKVVKTNFVVPNDSGHIWILHGPIITDSTGQIYAFPDISSGHNKILRYDTASKSLIWTLDSGIAGAGDSLVYGMYSYYDSAITIDLTQNVWTDVSNDSVIFTELESRGINHLEGDTFGLYYDGVYQLLISHATRMDSGIGGLVFRLLINGDSAGIEWGEYVGTSSDIITGFINVRLDSADKISIQVRNISNDNDIILFRGQMLITRIETAIADYDSDTDSLMYYSLGVYTVKTRNDTLIDQGITSDSLTGTIWPELNTNRVTADSGLFGTDSSYLWMLNRGDSGNIPQQGANGIVYWVTPTGGVGGADTTYIVFKNDTQMVVNNGYIYFEDSLIRVLHDKLQMDTAIIGGDTVTALLDLSTANVTVTGDWTMGNVSGDSISSPYLAKLDIGNSDTTGFSPVRPGELYVDTNLKEAYIAINGWQKIALLHSYFQAYEDTTYTLTFNNPDVFIAYFPEEVSPIWENMTNSGDSGIAIINPGLYSLSFNASISGSIDSMDVKANVFVGNNQSPYLRSEVNIDTAESSNLVINGYIIMTAGSILTIKMKSGNGDRVYIHDANFCMKREDE